MAAPSVCFWNYLRLLVLSPFPPTEPRHMSDFQYQRVQTYLPRQREAHAPSRTTRLRGVKGYVLRAMPRCQRAERVRSDARTGRQISAHSRGPRGTFLHRYLNLNAVILLF